MDVIEHATHVVAEVLNERIAQERRWGAQNHCPADWMTILGEEFGEACKAALEWRFGKEHRLSPDEAREKLREYRAELIQIAAVAVAAAQSLSRNELSDEGRSAVSVPLHLMTRLEAEKNAEEKERRRLGKLVDQARAVVRDLLIEHETPVGTTAARTEARKFLEGTPV